MFLNKYLFEKQSFESKNGSFKNIKFPRGNYQTIKLLNPNPNPKCKMKSAKNLLNTISVVYSSLQAQFFTETFLQASTIHLGIFGGRALFKHQSVSIEELLGQSCPAEMKCS